MNQVWEWADNWQHVLNIAPTDDHWLFHKEMCVDLDYVVDSQVSEQGVKELGVHEWQLVDRRLTKLHEFSWSRIFFKLDFD